MDSRIESPAEALRFLYDLRLFGAKLGLENPRRLAELAGNPQDRLRFIHVAGTNGKGSVCAFLESVARAAGLKTGLFTSPHLVRFGERIQVNRKLLSDTDILEGVRRLLPHLNRFPQEGHPTFFEVVTVLALRHFEQQGVDLVIWETGLGGRLDATNIVTPTASVITPVSLDHQQWLGNSLESIAREKAGIIKAGIPVFSAPQETEVRSVLNATAQDHHAPLRFVEAADLDQPPLDQIRLRLPGQHQRWNAALAAAALRGLRSTWSISEEALRSGLESTDWPGRMQSVKRPDADGEVWVDAAHNPAGVQALLDTLGEHLHLPLPGLVLGALSDKNWAALCRTLAPVARNIWTVPVTSERSAPPEELAAACREANPSARVHSIDSLEAALRASRDLSTVLVAGSVYLAGAALEALGALSTPVTGNQRELNDYGTGPNAS